ncbi:DUF3472 domain-containing protein [Chitinophaga barathri]|nr:DUF3472 domain-containing protein [Chitinophaga barathri]
MIKYCSNSLSLLLLAAFALPARAERLPSGDSTVVTLYSNGYVYPKADRGTGYISRNGLTAWKDASLFSRTYFVTAKTGKLDVSLTLKSSAPAKLKVELEGREMVLSVPATEGLVTLPVGTFSVKQPGYHFVKVTAADSKSTQLPDITALVLKGDAAEGAKANTSQYKSAPATHLSYPFPKDTLAEWFYNEISVPADAQPLHAYYMVNGWSGGYFGIQINSPTERRVLFSVWSAFSTDNPKDIPEEYRVKLIKKGADVTVNDFGNEGSGGQSYWRFNWKAETTYKLLLRGKPSGDHTVYSAWFYDPATSKWKFMATWDKPKSGKYLSGLYSFVENFGSNGDDLFKARYGNQWIRTANGQWIELTQARFSTTADAEKHPRFDIGSGVENGMFYMFSGGFREVGTTKKGDIQTRPAVKTPPVVDLEGLPRE